MKREAQSDALPADSITAENSRCWSACVFEGCGEATSDGEGWLGVICVCVGGGGIAGEGWLGVMCVCVGGGGYSVGRDG